MLGKDFFDRKHEITVLRDLALARNHVLISGQRRMGKTSLIRELSRQLETEGWVTFFMDVEGASSPEDFVSNAARTIHSARPIASRFLNTVRHFITENVDELSAGQFSLKLRENLDPGNWKRHGDEIFKSCSALDCPVVFAIDELPMFLTLMRRNDGDDRRVAEFLSWLRHLVQELGSAMPVLFLSGSIGLAPLVRRLNLTDRINYLHPFRVGPWSEEICVQFFNRMSTEYNLELERDSAKTAFALLGLGIPQHAQSFFARLREFATKNSIVKVTSDHVKTVYETELLGPSGQIDLVHYESRLKEALDDDSFTLAMEILAETAVERQFTSEGRHTLERIYSKLLADCAGQITDVLEILVHDGYLTQKGTKFIFASNLLCDWWHARFRDHYVSLAKRNQ